MHPNDICIVGAGPAGCAAALKLSQLGIPCTLVDKASFPRDKVCGDAISGKAATILRRIDPAIMQRFEQDANLQLPIWGIRFVAPNGIVNDVPFRIGYDPAQDPKQGYVARRVDFDNFLVSEVRRQPSIRFLEALEVEQIERADSGFHLLARQGKWELHSQLLIAANGANSAFSRHHANLGKYPRHHAGAVRAYFRDIKGLQPDGFIELHFLEEISPGYFWIFPLPGGVANVGIGMRSDHISHKRYNLTKGLESVIHSNPALSTRFADAELLGKITGYGLPLGSHTMPISGDHFMLTGDAAHLVDPLSGEGIGNAIYSGFMAAEQAANCLRENRFDAAYLKQYDERVHRVLGAEMHISYQLQRMMSRPWLVNLMARWVKANPSLIYVISNMYSDLALRKKVFSPLFWMRMLWRK